MRGVDLYFVVPRQEEGIFFPEKGYARPETVPSFECGEKYPCEVESGAFFSEHECCFTFSAVVLTYEFTRYHNRISITYDNIDEFYADWKIVDD